MPWLRTPKRTIVEIGKAELEISMPTIVKKTTTKTVNRGINGNKIIEKEKYIGAKSPPMYQSVARRKVVEPYF